MVEVSHSVLPALSIVLAWPGVVVFLAMYEMSTGHSASTCTTLLRSPTLCSPAWPALLPVPSRCSPLLVFFFFSSRNLVVGDRGVVVPQMPSLSILRMCYFSARRILPWVRLALALQDWCGGGGLVGAVGAVRRRWCRCVVRMVVAARGGCLVWVFRLGCPPLSVCRVGRWALPIDGPAIHQALAWLGWP